MPVLIDGVAHLQRAKIIELYHLKIYINQPNLTDASSCFPGKWNPRIGEAILFEFEEKRHFISIIPIAYCAASLALSEFNFKGLLPKY